MSSRAMPNVVSALTARTQLGQIIKRTTQNNERFLIARRGEPSAIIMSLRDYIDTFAPSPKWLTEIQAGAKERGLDKLNMREIDSLIGEVRAQRRAKARSRTAK